MVEVDEQAIKLVGVWIPTTKRTHDYGYAQKLRKAAWQHLVHPHGDEDERHEDHSLNDHGDGIDQLCQEDRHEQKGEERVG